MRSSIIISAVLGAGALAHPQLRPLHQHKRDQEIKSWIEGDVQYEEFIAVVTDFPEDFVPSSTSAAATTSTPPIQEKVEYYHPAPKVTTSASPSPVAPVAASTAEPSPAPSTTPPSSSDDSPCSTSSQSGGPASDWAESPCSAGNSIINTINSMRNGWNSSLQDYPLAWSSTLSNNAYLTATITEHDAESMIHKLNPGSMGQCEAEGMGADAFQEAYKMWLCEIPMGNIGCGSTPSADETGHALINENTGYSHIGCYYMNAGNAATGTGIWTCDYA